jgi:catechol 2,3-dioxygenase-like lactoylglutathione lyase family enzyme/GNAT superfamily N-acetyltransferase
MIFKHGVPILYSEDVRRSLLYYTDILGFDGRWEWGNPPDFGGVHKDSVEIFFCEKGQGNPGTWFSVFVDDVDEFYHTIREKGAKILTTPENMEWGVREMIVEDPDGHRIRFGQNAHVSDRVKSEAILPQSVRITGRMPSANEAQQLSFSIGWSSSPETDNSTEPYIEIVHAAIAEDTLSNKVIGCVFLYGDSTGFYYVRNLMVDPNWQNKRVGTALMYEITRWLDNNAVADSSVWLHSGERLEPFYRQFGFVPVFGMMRQMHHRSP